MLDRMTATRTATTLAALVLALGGLAGCGGGDGEGGNDNGGSGGDGAATVSKADFCDGFQQLVTDASGLSEKDLPDQIAAVKKQVAELKDLGTPEGMPAEAQRGFETFTDAVSKIDDDATQKDLQDLGKDLDKQAQAEGQAFLTWVESNCLTESPAESPAE